MNNYHRITCEGIFGIQWLLNLGKTLIPPLFSTYMYVLPKSVGYMKLLLGHNNISSFNVSCWDYKNEIKYYLPVLEIIVYISCWSNHYSSFELVRPPAPLSALSLSSTNSSGKIREAVKVSKGGAVPPNSAGRNCGSMSVCTWVKSEPWTCN